MSTDKLTPKQKKELAEAVASLGEMFEDERLAQHLANQIRKFTGNFDHLESALGALVLGRLVGWEVLRITHSNATFNRMERILALDLRGGSFPWSDEPILQKRAVYSRKSVALSVVDRVGDFWQVFQGKSDITRFERKELQ